MRTILYILTFFALFFTSMLRATAGDIVPTISPEAYYMNADGTIDEEPSPIKTGSAPIVGYFHANPADYDGWTLTCEWRFTREKEQEPYLVRYEQDTEVTFTDYGLTRIVCYATFVQGSDTIAYARDYWAEEMLPFTCTVSASKLEMPNAFSPNGDGINDFYAPKQGCQSIVEFHATIFNRYGQKLYEWTDPYAEGWDGTYKGTPVKDGVYYCLVKALGADGIRYTFKRDVNLLRGYTETTGPVE